MSRALLSLACHLYGAAAIVYLAYLVRQAGLVAAAGRVVLGLGLVAHAGALAVQLTGQGGAPHGLSQALSFVAFLLLLIFAVVDVAYRKPVIGAFITPVAVAVLVPALLLPSAPGPMLPEGIRQPLLPLHISIALVGVAAFAVATGVAVMYLLLERQMKGKRFGLLFSRLPSLQLLDELNRRLVVAGFIALSVTLATGALFAADPHTLGLRFDSKEIATVVAWGLFAGLISARFFAGWRGKRVALLTMAGFCVLLVSFFTAFDAAGVTR